MMTCLLFGSGMCALICQIVGLREPRLFLGTSTAASAAVLAVFMAGLGFGSIHLGRRAGAAERPLALYAKLEILITFAAAISPLLVALARAAYIASGGTGVWGQGVGSLLRLLLSAVILGAPTFFMGGTMPAAARAVVTEDDQGRRKLALLYGANAVGALTHPDPKRALVVGLGAGSTAGWLAAIPSMERVDAIELEPSVLRFARQCGAVNHNAMENPKLHARVGDAREVILATREQYDIIASEPSNPYRAGVASLFTREFYRAAAARLREGGRFCQWIQAYEVDSETIRTIYATLLSAFDEGETWQTLSGDLCFVASQRPCLYDAGALRERLRQEPWRSAVAFAWRAWDLEGVLAHSGEDGSRSPGRHDVVPRPRRRGAEVAVRGQGAPAEAAPLS